MPYFNLCEGEPPRQTSANTLTLDKVRDLMASLPPAPPRVYAGQAMYRWLLSNLPWPVAGEAHRHDPFSSFVTLDARLPEWAYQTRNGKGEVLEHGDANLGIKIDVAGCMRRLGLMQGEA